MTGLSIRVAPSGIRAIRRRASFNSSPVRYRNRWGRERAYTSGFEGAVSFVRRKHAETESEWSRERKILPA